MSEPFHDEEIPPRRLANLCRVLLREGLSDMRFNLYSKMHPDYQDEDLVLFDPVDDSVALPHSPEASIACQLSYEGLALLFWIAG